uniref:Uncharacterized protein n=1 Tax=Arundo donax TaxID=35708 RepID=A0A0A9HAJ7_ARUDO
MEILSYKNDGIKLEYAIHKQYEYKN